MKYMYIGKDSSSLFLNCDTLKVYKLPLIIAIPSKKDTFLFACYFSLFLSLPVVYRIIPNMYLIYAIVLISMVFAVIAQSSYQKTGDKKFDSYIAKYPKSMAPEKNTVLNIYRKYMVKCLLLLPLITAVIIYLTVDSVSLFYYFEPPRYQLLIMLNLPSLLVLSLLSLNPFRNMKYYFRFKAHEEQSEPEADTDKDRYDYSDYLTSWNDKYDR